MRFTSSPSGDNRHNVRSIYPFVLIPLLTLLLTVGAMNFYLKSHAAAPTNTHVHFNAKNTVVNTPSSITWYIDGGSVGGGFQEFLTIQNPNTTAATVTITYLLQANPPVNPIHTRSVNHTIAASTRQTIDVDHDLNTSQTGTHITAAAIVHVTNNVPIVVERPWYFNNLGVATGTDAFGVTIPQKNYYFAEGASLKANKAGQPAYNTFVSVLNPSTTVTAHATITYYNGSCGGNGQTACQVQQATLIPLQRQVLIPANGQNLYAKYSIAVTADVPVVAERLTYIKDNIINAGGFTTGAIMNVGATAPGTDWLFAEGFTGSGFQEYFELANFGNTAANAQVKLEYTNGATQTVAVSVPALGITQFDVNAHPGPTTAASAEITSDNPIVAERLMYFHFGPNKISGTTDVVGIPAAQQTYAFAEGFTSSNFTEFLTLQNPNAVAETATVIYYLTTTSFQLQYNLAAHSRTTINVNGAIASRGGGAVSMLVSATGSIVAERPMYFIYGSGTTTEQGGTDVIGFTG